MVNSLDPRTYANAPVDLNQLELDYAYANSNASIDTSLVISGAHLDLNQATASYTRTFGLASGHCPGSKHTSATTLPQISGPP